LANHKSALKRIRQTEKRRLRNRAVRSQMRTVLKKFYQAVDGELEGADLGEMHRSTVSTIARAATKGVLHKRTADRKISRITAYLNKAQTASA